MTTQAAATTAIRHAMLMRPTDDGGYLGVLLRPATLADMETGACAPFPRVGYHPSHATVYAVAGPRAGFDAVAGRTPETHMTMGTVAVDAATGQASYQPDGFTAAMFHEYGHIARLVDEGVGGPPDHPAMRVIHVTGTVVPSRHAGGQPSFRTTIGKRTHHRRIEVDAIPGHPTGTQTCLAVRVLDGEGDPKDAKVVALGMGDPLRATEANMEAYLTAIAGPSRADMPEAAEPTTRIGDNIDEDDTPAPEADIERLLGIAIPIEDAFPAPAGYPSATYHGSLVKMAAFLKTVATCTPGVTVDLLVEPLRATLSTSMRLPSGQWLRRTKVVDQGREAWDKKGGTLALMSDLTAVDGNFMHLTTRGDGDGGYYERRSVLRIGKPGGGHADVMADYFDSRAACDDAPQVGLRLQVAPTTDDAKNVAWLFNRDDE